MRPATTNDEDTLDFKRMLDEVSRNFGFKDLAGSKSTLIPHQPEASKRTTHRKNSMDEDPEEELKKDGKQKSVTDLMKDTHMVERYS